MEPSSKTNITVKSENGQFFIIRNITPDVSITQQVKSPTISTQPTILQSSQVDPKNPIFTMANTNDEGKGNRLVYAQLMSVPQLLR